MYASYISKIQNSPLDPKVLPAFLAYLLMILGLVFIVFDSIKKDPSENILYLSFRYGWVFGLVVYGVYNATNYAIFKNYSIKMALIDTLWGSFVYFFATLSGLYIGKMLA
jgi:uncharacterized membrane protein